jgi:hypothetical protein
VEKDTIDFETAFENTHLANPNITRELYQQMREEQNRKRMGVIAQEVENVVPEVVRTRDDGLKAVAYSEMVGLLIEAIKEQQTLIDDLRSEVEAIKGTDQLRSSNSEESATGFSNDIIKSATLYQNAPNPFTGQTEIRYYLPEGVKAAFICIFDLQGKMLKKSEASVGENRLIIRRSELQAGMFLYSLVVDGKEVDTKRMILTK